jgi:hypothetical protein
MSVVFNNICERCDNISICSAWKNIKKFSDDYSKNPLPVDIEIKNCDKYISVEAGDENPDNEPEEINI